MTRGADSDREMRCASCGARIVTSRAPELVKRDFRCPRCGADALELVPAPVRRSAAAEHHFGYPTVTQVAARP